MYSQRDPRWKDVILGTKGKIGDYGCTLVSICNLLSKHGHEIDPNEANDRIKGVDGYADGNLIIWSKLKEALPIEDAYRYYEYDNDKVSQAIKDNKGCLVEADGSRIGGIKHWVLFIGDGKEEDPWTGNYKPTDYYIPLTGYAILKIKENSMSNMYGGLDLEDAESMKVCVDMWNRVKDGVYVEKEKLTSMTESINKLQKQIDDHVCPITTTKEGDDGLTLTERVEETDVDKVKIIKKYTIHRA